MSFLASIGSAIGGAFSSVAGDLISNWQTNQYEKKAASKQFERELYLMDKQFDKDVEMWNKQNAYNTPLAQMERYKAAGLNPNLIYSQGNSGNASSAPSMHSGSASKAGAGRANFDLDFGKLMPLFQMENLNAQNKLINAQTEAATQDALNKGLMNIRYGIENEYLPQKLQKEIDLMGTNYNPVNRVVNGVLDFGNGLMSGNVFTDARYRQSEMDYRRGLYNIYGNKWREHYLPPEKRYR